MPRDPAVTPHANNADNARHRPSAWGRTLGAFLDCARGIGLDPDELRRAIGVDSELLADPDGRVPLEAVYAFVELVVERTGDEHAPLALVRGLDVEAFDALGLLALTSATLGEALERTLRYQRIFAEGERYELEQAGDLVHVRYTPWGPPRRAHVAMAEMFARDLAVHVAQVSGAPVPGVRVRLRERPRDPARLAALLGLEPELGGPIDEVIYPAAALEIPIPRADPAVARFFERYLDERLARLPPDSPVGRVRAGIEALLPSATLSKVARRLGASPRTLQRWLASEGTSFAALVEEVRRARALALVEAGASIAEVAWMLGYSEPSAFHRAFRRWTGTTPAQWRARE